MEANYYPGQVVVCAHALCVMEIRRQLPRTCQLQPARSNIQSVGKRGEPIFWVLVADLGGFTVDFSMMGLNPFDPTEPVQGEHEGMSRQEYKSYALGIRDLDASVIEALPDGPSEALTKMLQAIDSGSLEQFHRDVYQHQRPVVRLGRSQTLSEADKHSAHDCVQQFAEEVAERAAEFLNSYGYGHVDELVLTGGGFNIPTVRDRMCEFIESRNGDGAERFHAYVPATPAEERSLPSHRSRILPKWVRGATAIGGASIAFDLAEV